MRLRRETSIGVAVLIGLQILLSVLSIALLIRMGPAVDTFLETNVSNEQAVEDMLAIAAATTEPGPVPANFDKALEHFTSHVEKGHEGESIRAIKRLKEEAFLENKTAKVEMVQKLRDLGTENRSALSAASDYAKRLGEAGAWAAAFLGALGFIFGLATYRQLLIRIELPIDRVLATFLRIRAGNHQARCTLEYGPSEIQQIASELNWVIDQWQKALRRRQANVVTQTATDHTSEEVSRRLLCSLIDRLPAPLAIQAPDGSIAARNQLALGVDVKGWTVTPLANGPYAVLTPEDAVIPSLGIPTNEGSVSDTGVGGAREGDPSNGSKLPSPPSQTSPATHITTDPEATSPKAAVAALKTKPESTNVGADKTNDATDAGDGAKDPTEKGEDVKEVKTGEEGLGELEQEGEEGVGDEHSEITYAVDEWEDQL